jgi:hypothetical protein
MDSPAETEKIHNSSTFSSIWICNGLDDAQQHWEDVLTQSINSNVNLFQKYPHNHIVFSN